MFLGKYCAAFSATHDGESSSSVFGIVIVLFLLSYSPVGAIDGRELIFGKKSIRGFWLTDWVRHAGFFNIARALVSIQKKMADGSIALNIRKKLRLEEVPEWILEYAAKMTAGKIMICPRIDRK